MTKSLSNPTAVQLIAAVRGFLTEKVSPQLDAQSAFHLRVACNALGIVERELQQAEKANAAAAEKLGSLLDADPAEADVPQLVEALCEQIRSGEQDIEDPRLRESLRAFTLARLAIDNPNYSGYKQALS